VVARPAANEIRRDGLQLPEPRRADLARPASAVLVAQHAELIVGPAQRVRPLAGPMTSSGRPRWLQRHLSRDVAGLVPPTSVMLALCSNAAVTGTSRRRQRQMRFERSRSAPLRPTPHHPHRLNEVLAVALTTDAHLNERGGALRRNDDNKLCFASLQ
jgi:hypothetical protein